jgi:hypothetical protein
MVWVIGVGVGDGAGVGVTISRLEPVGEIFVAVGVQYGVKGMSAASFDTPVFGNDLPWQALKTRIERINTIKSDLDICGIIPSTSQLTNI